ncbi:hypothetical protein ACH4XT_39180 [Streptomyces avidinii]|uniref:hypothetical protein n=1 Tax=Streptomyces avidinii TaxID=1895 RepID=UPI00379F1FAF
MRLLFGWVPVDDRAWEVQTPPDAEAFAAAALDEDEMAAGFVEQVAAVEVAALRHARVVKDMGEAVRRGVNFRPSDCGRERR